MINWKILTRIMLIKPNITIGHNSFLKKPLDFYNKKIEKFAVFNRNKYNKTIINWRKLI